MNKKLSLLLTIIIFLTMQTLSLMHVMEYGDRQHEHHGKVCDICLNADQNKLFNDNPAIITLPSFTSFEVSLLTPGLLSSNLINFFDSRAPPFFF